MPVPLPELHFLTDDECNDYRPAIGPTGEVVIFERKRGAKGETVLYRIGDLQAPHPEPFLTDPSAPPSQTRPDWDWRSDRIAFNGAALPGVWIAKSNGEASAVPATKGLVYPTWIGHHGWLVASNYSTTASPSPCNSIFDSGGVVRSANINGSDSAGTSLYGGMPAAKPGQAELIAFAGQPATDNWGGTGTATYAQALNYIFLNAIDERGQFTSLPMEPGAPLASYDQNYQGRAPSWSPDGRTIAFESKRSRQGYAIYLFDIESGSITQVTDPALGAQHAKFFPCGTKLVLCAQPEGSWSIAWVDISNLLQR